MGKTILLVEDDAQTRALSQEPLSAAGHRVLATDCVASGWRLFTAERPDLAILDLELPDGSGFDLCRRIREHRELSFTPVIILTGSSGFESKASGFSAGADQYLVKPVPPKELLLWAEALLRRLALDRQEGAALTVGGLEVDVDAHLARFKGEPIEHLTVKEFELLCFLVRNRPKVLSRKLILSRLWHTIAVDHVVDTHLTNLRKKLPQELSDKIQNIPGKGFRFLG